MKLSLAYSPCPNDTFAFHAMVHSLTDCEGLSFDVTLLDIEELNRGAANGVYDICKISYSAFFNYISDYVMLRCGGALGYNNGPLLVARGDSPIFKQDGGVDRELISRLSTAIPGEMTTAALLLKFAFPEITLTHPILFSNIERAVIEREFDLGLLIHETRFTYQSRGLRLVCDLGELWQQRFLLPVPLGGIAVKRSLGEENAKKIGRVLKRSIEFAIASPELSREYRNLYARESGEDIQRRHIEMFVNRYTLDVSEVGERAVLNMYNIAADAYSLEKCGYNLFI
jgi:1,4-dihydroxy-6-naphthoate synthase